MIARRVPIYVGGFVKNFEFHGSRRVMLRGNFESFSRDELPEAQLKKLPLDDEMPPPHAFFTTQASRPVLMTFGLRIFIPLMVRNAPRARFTVS